MPLKMQKSLPFYQKMKKKENQKKEGNEQRYKN